MNTNDVPIGFKNTDLGLIPDEWDFHKISDLMIKIRSGGTPKRSTSEYWKGIIPFALIEDLTKNDIFIDSISETITESGLKNSSAWIVPDNSILLSMMLLLVRST